MTEDWLWQWVHEQPDLTLARLQLPHKKVAPGVEAG